MSKLDDFINEHREEFDGIEPEDKLWKNINAKLSGEDLEEFVIKNRESFNTIEPSYKVWSKLSVRLDEIASSKPLKTNQKESKMVPISWVWGVAAMFTIVLAAIIGFQQLDDRNADPLSDSKVLSMEQVAPELQEAEQYYTQLISEKKNQIQSYDLKEMGLEQDFSQELSTLDSMYAQLRGELLQDAPCQQVVDAMIQNLQIRIDILNQQLSILEKIKKAKESPKNETNI